MRRCMHYVISGVSGHWERNGSVRCAATGILHLHTRPMLILLISRALALSLSIVSLWACTKWQLRVTSLSTPPLWGFAKKGAPKRLPIDLLCKNVVFVGQASAVMAFFLCLLDAALEIQITLLCCVLLAGRRLQLLNLNHSVCVGTHGCSFFTVVVAIN